MALDACKLSWIDAGSTTIRGCLGLERPKMVFWAVGKLYGICSSHVFLNLPSHSCYAAFFYSFSNI